MVTVGITIIMDEIMGMSTAMMSGTTTIRGTGDFAAMATFLRRITVI